jgi:hypothetical protein
MRLGFRFPRRPRLSRRLTPFTNALIDAVTMLPSMPTP